jgi:hypothetical protein
MDKFDLNKFLTENRMTKNSKTIAESSFGAIPGSGAGTSYYDRLWQNTVTGSDAIRVKERDELLMQAAGLAQQAQELEPELSLKEIIELIYEFT